MPDPAPQRVFISYARKDASDLALRLETDLTARGFRIPVGCVHFLVLEERT